MKLRLMGLMVVFSLLGCSEEASNAEATEGQEEAPAAEETAPAAEAEVESWTTRGDVRAIDGDRLTIAHENIPDYMPAMTMPFFVGEGVSIEGIAVGDRVSFRMHREAGGRHVIDAIEKL